ncbi:DL-endopeptidase inhibitor IseA family protein [Pseudoneobacillus sp. C159]
MKTNKLVLSGLALSILFSPIYSNPTVSKAAEANQYTISASKQKNEVVLTKAQIVKLAADYASAHSYVQRGGDYKDGEYKTFTQNGKVYRYLASDIDTKGELLALLKKSLTPKEAENFFAAQAFIQKNGKLAQLEADGGSLLKWAKATVTFVKADKKTNVYQLSVPVGETAETALYQVELQKINSKEWRISKIPYAVKTTQEIQVKNHQLSLPVELKINTGLDSFTFSDKGKFVGGLDVLTYNSQTQKIQNLLPNHSKMIDQNELKGYAFPVVAVNLEIQSIAKNGKTETVKQTHYYIIDQKQNLAFDLYIIKGSLKETQIEAILKSFK